MVLQDGTNEEREDVVPPLDWKTKDDLKDVILYGTMGSPPVVKVATVLKYYKIEYKFQETQPGKGYKEGASYKKIPVLGVKDRVINDSSIILRNLFKVLDEKFDQKLEEDIITFGLQPALEAEVFVDPSDFRNYVVTAAGMKAIGYVPLFMMKHVLIPFLGIASSIKKKYPELKSATEYASTFKAAISQNSIFWSGNDEPGSVDLSVFGTFYPFMKSKCVIADKVLNDAGLAPWYQAMISKMPTLD